ncbi:MAG: hypothetical protein IJB30_08700, partial [Clostridia bacterium]|nr:hypothetical protein [Clostridia bacterium]
NIHPIVKTTEISTIFSNFAGEMPSLKDGGNGATPQSRFPSKKEGIATDCRGDPFSFGRERRGLLYFTTPPAALLM